MDGARQHRFRWLLPVRRLLRHHGMRLQPDASRRSYVGYCNVEFRGTGGSKDGLSGILLQRRFGGTRQHRDLCRSDKSSKHDCRRNASAERIERRDYSVVRFRFRCCYRCYHLCGCKHWSQLFRIGGFAQYNYDGGSDVRDMLRQYGVRRYLHSVHNKLSATCIGNDRVYAWRGHIQH